MLVTIAAAALLAAPIPPTTAFRLPSAQECVGARTLTFNVRALPAGTWTRATVSVDGKRVKRVTNPRPERDIRVRNLPLGTFKVTLSARTKDGRTATANRTYRACPQGARPTVTIPPGAPPTTLVTRDLIVGTGKTARAGTTLKVHYVGVAWSDGKTFDASWDRGAAFEFALGAGQVIPGFDEGLEGMRVGGRRELILPPEFGYGEAGAPPLIGPDETLVFVVDLIAVKG